ncbi:MAG: glutamate cyclase domain-containing protein [Dehalococcoidia bacterium]
MTSRSIEDIILQKDIRNMTALRPHLPDRFVDEAAEMVLEHPGKALIATGFYILKAEAPETDGPPGAAAIGGALKQLGYEVVYVTDKFSMPAVEAVAGDDAVIEFPVATHFESARFANSLIQEHSPAVLISIERAGLMGDGTYRNWKGVDFSKYNAKIDHLFDQHPYSVGIGDGGNEIGMGNLREVIPGIDGLPDDPCVTTTTKLIIASCSNWGGYGVVAALSQLTDRNLLPSVEQGYQWVKDIVEAGAVEGMSGERKDWVDARNPEEDSVCLRDLHDLLRGL